MQNNTNEDFIVLDEKRKPNVYAISSLCEDGNHVIIWDFDIIKQPKNFWRIENSLKSIQRSFLLSSIYLIETRFGYNAICLDKLDKNSVGNIKNLTFGDDRKHLEQGISYNWYIRIGKDKKLVSVIDTEKFTKYTRSNAHRIALNNLMNIKIDKTRFFDESGKILLCSYWDWKTHIELGTEEKNKNTEEIDRQEDEFSYTMR
jgi:hypothetical protein